MQLILSLDFLAFEKCRIVEFSLKNNNFGRTGKNKSKTFMSQQKFRKLFRYILFLFSQMTRVTKITWLRENDICLFEFLL